MSVNAIPLRRVPQQPMRFTAGPGYRPSGSPVVAIGSSATGSPSHAQQQQQQMQYSNSNGANTSGANTPTHSQSGTSTPRRQYAEQQRDQREDPTQAQAHSAPSSPPLAHRPQLVQYSRPALGNPAPGTGSGSATPRSLGLGSASTAAGSYATNPPQPDDRSRRSAASTPAMLSVIDAAVSSRGQQTPRGGGGGTQQQQRSAPDAQLAQQPRSSDYPGDSPTESATASFDFGDYPADTLRLDDDERKGDSERVVKTSSRGSATPRGVNSSSNHAGGSNTPRNHSNHAGGSSTPRGPAQQQQQYSSSTVPNSTQSTPRRLPRENRATAPSGITFDVDALNRSPARMAVGSGNGGSDESKNDRESTDRVARPKVPVTPISPDVLNNSNVTFNFASNLAPAASTTRSSNGGSSGNSANGSTRVSPNTSVPPSPTHQRSESAQPALQQPQSQLQQLQQQQPPLLRPSSSQQLSQRPSTPRGPLQTAHMQVQPPIPSRPRVANRPQQSQQQPQPVRISPQSGAGDRYSAAFASMDIGGATTPTSANGTAAAPSVNPSYPMRPGTAGQHQRSPSNSAFPNGAPQLLVQQSVSISSVNGGSSAAATPNNAASAAAASAAAANGLVSALPPNRRHARNVSFAEGQDLLHYDDQPLPRLPAAKLARFQRAMFLANGQPKPAMKFSPQPSPREGHIRGAQLSADALRLHRFRSRQLQESLMIHTVLSGAPLTKFSQGGKPQRRWFFVEETDTEHRLCWENVESNPLKNHNGLQSLGSSSSAVATSFAASGAGSIASLPARARRDSSSSLLPFFQIGRWKFNQDRSRSLIDVTAMHYGPFYSANFGEELRRSPAATGSGSGSGAGSSSSSGGGGAGYPWLCFSLQFTDRTVDLQCATESEVTRWFLGLQGLVPHSVYHLSRGMMLWQRAVMKLNYWGMDKVRRDVMASDRNHHLHATALYANASAAAAANGSGTARGGAGAAAAGGKHARQASAGGAAPPLLRRGSSFSLPAPALVRAGSVGRSLSITLSRRKSQSEQMKARPIEYDFTSRSS